MHVENINEPESAYYSSNNVWTMGWMRQNFDTDQFFKTVAGYSGGMRLCIFQLKQSAFSINKTFQLTRLQATHCRLDQVAS